MHLFSSYLQSWARTEEALVIGVYELLGNPTTSLSEPPGPHKHMTYHLSFNKINTKAVTSGSTTAYATGAHEFNPIFTCVHVALKLQLYCFVDYSLSFWYLSHGLCIVSPSSIDGFL